MKNITNKTKIILFAAIIGVMIIPFSSMEMVNAIPNENANDKAHKQRDFKNYEAEEIFKELAPYKISKDGKEKKHSEKDLKKITELENKLRQSQEKHKEKIIDKELQKKLKEAYKKIVDKKLPVNIIAQGLDHIYVQIPNGKSANVNANTENAITEIMQELPYKIEYGNGLQHTSVAPSLECDSTQSNCNPKIGGIKYEMQVSWIGSSTCTLSIPIQKDGVDGFLTAGHCFNEGTTNVYQPTLGNPVEYLGFTNSTLQIFENWGTCDCAWIQDESLTIQQSGIFVYPGSYWVIDGVQIPKKGDEVMWRGQFNNNGQWWESNTIEYPDVTFFADGVWTAHTMAFQSSGIGGDSGGPVFYNGKFMGIVVAGGYIGGIPHLAFIPWNHIDENISGLTL